MSNKPVIYLAGRMTGLVYSEAKGWRDAITKMLEPEVRVLSPMRGQAASSFTGDPVSANCNAGFEMSRDMVDIERCDAVLAKFGLDEPVSFGTAIELGTLIPLRKPAILLIDPADKLMKHPFLLAFPRSTIVHTLEDAAYYIHSMFNV